MSTITKITAKLLTITTFAGIGTVVSNTTVDASTWHKGTPKVLQGNWKNKQHQTFKITKNGFYYGPKVGVEKTTYKYIGNHKYKFRVAGAKMTITATKHHMNYDHTSWTK